MQRKSKSFCYRAENLYDNIYHGVRDEFVPVVAVGPYEP
jgi:hypothetical protein